MGGFRADFPIFFQARVCDEHTTKMADFGKLSSRHRRIASESALSMLLVCTTAILLRTSVRVQHSPSPFVEVRWEERLSGWLMSRVTRICRYDYLWLLQLRLYASKYIFVFIYLVRRSVLLYRVVSSPRIRKIQQLFAPPQKFSFDTCLRHWNAFFLWLNSAVVYSRVYTTYLQFENNKQTKPHTSYLIHCTWYLIYVRYDTSTSSAVPKIFSFFFSLVDMIKSLSIMVDHARSSRKPIVLLVWVRVSEYIIPR